MRLEAATVAAMKRLLRGAERVLLVTHLAPDGDAIGSLVGMGLGLRQLGKRMTLACDDPAPARYEFLPLVREMVQPNGAAFWPCDLVVALDCGDEERMGRTFSQLRAQMPASASLPPLINIDHHVTNSRFGQVNLVEPGATSTGEILFHLMPALGIEITPEVATCLLTAVVTDTLGFRTAGVTAETVRVAGALMEAGADLSYITMQALNLKPLSTLKLYQKGLANMQFQDGFLWTVISREERLAAGHAEASSAGLVNLLGDVEQAAMGAVLLQMDNGEVYAGFRCRPPWDVAELAASLGGGGHPLAAGCTLNGDLHEVEALVVARGLAEIARQRRAQAEKAAAKG